MNKTRSVLALVLAATVTASCSSGPYRHPSPDVDDVSCEQDPGGAVFVTGRLTNVGDVTVTYVLEVSYTTPSVYATGATAIDNVPPGITETFRVATGTEVWESPSECSVTNVEQAPII